MDTNRPPVPTNADEAVTMLRTGMAMGVNAIIKMLEGDAFVYGVRAMREMLWALTVTQPIDTKSQVHILSIEQLENTIKTLLEMPFGNKNEGQA